MNKIIYLDNASKTIPYKEAIEEHNDVSSFDFANPSSIHILGQRNNRKLDQIRLEVLSLLHLENSHQVIFTSGATESNNLAIKGVALNYQNRGKHLITSIYEHASVLECFKQLEENFGFEVTYLLPNKEGIITPSIVEAAIRKDTILVSIMEVNNEIGAINDVNKIGEMLKKYPKVIFHSDIAQAIGKTEKLSVYNNVDLLSISAHKIHGLVGTGLLIKKKNMNLLPLFSGGGQENNLRSGTNDLAGASSTLVALRKILKESRENFNKVKELNLLLRNYLLKHPDLYELNSEESSSPYILNFSTKTKKSSVVVEALSNAGIMVSSTSACHSRNEKGSYVVASINKSEKISKNTVRVSFSYENTKEEVETLINELNKIIEVIR